MLGDLTRLTDTQLLEFFMLILSKPDKEISPFDHSEMTQINDEFLRRGFVREAYADLLASKEK
jgi:hypothetical protein